MTGEHQRSSHITSLPLQWGIILTWSVFKTLQFSLFLTLKFFLGAQPLKGNMDVSKLGKNLLKSVGGKCVSIVTPYNKSNFIEQIFYVDITS